jgi:hypothetical protein
MTRLGKAEALAVQHLSKIEAGLLLGKWAAVRTAAQQLAALAESRQHRRTNERRTDRVVHKSRAAVPQGGAGSGRGWGAQQRIKQHGRADGGCAAEVLMALPHQGDTNQYAETPQDKGPGRNGRPFFNLPEISITQQGPRQHRSQQRTNTVTSLRTFARRSFGRERIRLLATLAASL